MNAAEKKEIHLVTLRAQPYDIEASGFYFHSFEDYEEKAGKNLNRFGEPVEEYEFQYIDGECNQEILDHLPLKEFFEVVETWDSEEIEKIELLADLLGWHYIGATADEIKEKFDDLILTGPEQSKDDLGHEVFSNYNSEAFQAMKDHSLLWYFDFASWLEDTSANSGNAQIISKSSGYFYAEYIG